MDIKGKTYGLQIYQGQEFEDFLLVKTWMRMVECKDLDKVTRPDRQSLRWFLETLSPPRITVYGLNKQKSIDYLCWLELASDLVDENTIVLNLWIDPDSRKTRNVVLRTIKIYENIFEKLDNCLILTWVPENIALYQKFGYKTVGYYPELYRIKNVYSLWMTKNDFYNSKAYKIMR
jgi:hypothetical protein